MFSEKYIKMCEKAEDIQKAWEPREGKDFYQEKGSSQTWPVSKGEREKIKKNRDNYIWLPIGDLLDRPELKGSWTLNEIKESMKKFQEEVNQGRIKVVSVPGFYRFYNLQAAMYIFNFKEWDDEAEKWILR